MKLPVPSRKVRLTLSILFLLFSLVFLWWAVGSPMPTPGLAHRAALLSYGLTPGPVEAQGEIHFQEITRSPDSSEGSRWLVSRQEDGWAVTVHPKAGLFWSQSNSRVQLLTPSEDTPLMAAHLQYATDYLWEEGISENPFDDGDWYWEWVTLAVCTLPDVARIELYQGWYNSIDANGLSPGTGCWSMAALPTAPVSHRTAPSGCASRSGTPAKELPPPWPVPMTPRAISSASGALTTDNSSSLWYLLLRR